MKCFILLLVCFCLSAWSFASFPGFRYGNGMGRGYLLSAGMGVEFPHLECWLLYGDWDLR